MMTIVVFGLLGLVLLIIIVAVTIISQPPEKIAKKLTGAKDQTGNRAG